MKLDTPQPSDFDPYYRWLGIPKGQRPPNHYRLLGISPKEEEQEVIEAAIERQTNAVKTQRTAQYEKIAARVLFEIQEAGVVILDRNRRKEYDAALARPRRQPTRAMRKAAVPPYSPYKPAGEGNEIVRSYFGVMSVILAGFIIMAVVSFMLPWRRVVFGIQEPKTTVEAKDVEAAQETVRRPVVAQRPVANVAGDPKVGGQNIAELAAKPKPEASAVDAKAEVHAETITKTDLQPASTESPSESVGPRIVEHRTNTWDGSKENYASSEGLQLSVGMGHGDWGFGHAGVLLQDVRRLELDAAISKKLKGFDADSLAGFILDYHTSAGFVSRIALTTGLHSLKRGDKNPWWGKSSVPDRYVEIGKQRRYTLDLEKWAPPDWDGQCWFSVNIENSGANTSFQARITKMIGRDDVQVSNEVVAATRRGLSVIGKWQHSASGGAGWEIEFFPNGHIGKPVGPANWTLKGRNLTLRWPGAKAPNGVWVDRCVVSPDGKSYVGKNQKGAVIRGIRIE